MADGDLILLPVAKPDDDAPITKEFERFCAHRRARIDGTARRLYCRECEREIDAMDFLIRLANDYGYYVRAREAALAKMQKANRELVDVERRVKNAKARARRAGDGLPLLDLEDRSRIERLLVGSITSAVDAHGSITRANVSSAAKRVYGTLKAAARSQG
jgi:hypothetical protein